MLTDWRWAYLDFSLIFFLYFSHLYADVFVPQVSFETEVLVLSP